MLKKVLPLPGVQHGDRILVSAIESRAQNPSDKPWASIPVNDQDLSQGFKDISFRQLNNYANHAAKWLSETLPETNEPFQCFAYGGPKDLRYTILAVAAAKLQKVMIVPSPMVTPAAQLLILQAKNCTLYLRPDLMANMVGAILKDAPNVQQLSVPDDTYFLREEEAPSYVYSKTWEEGNNDPWMVFHTSGTTGNPKTITYTQRMMATIDISASQPDIEPSQFDQSARTRLYTPLPTLHYAGMALSLAVTTFLESTFIFVPNGPPTPSIVAEILQYGKVDGVVLIPAIIEELCLSPSGLEALRKLKYIHYVGAPLSANAGEKLISHVPIVAAIGSTEVNIYHTSLHNKKDAWDYMAFQKSAGAEFEHRFDGLHELIFVRRPQSKLQQIFDLYPNLDRYETKDLWIEHPTYKGLWKIVGRTDDMVIFLHGHGLYASTVESAINAHPAVKDALIGGHGYSGPVLLVEFYPDAEIDSNQGKVIDSLRPYVEKANEGSVEAVHVSLDRVVFATKEKPFIRTAKGSVSRVQSVGLYKAEIAALFE